MTATIDITAIERVLLECGHRQPVKPLNQSTWCPICGTTSAVA